MKIVLYGVSGSGKNYLIDKVVKRTNGIKYLSGSTTLKRLAEEQFSMDFKALSADKQNQLRSQFTKEVDKEENENKGYNIIVDGHYSFPNENSGYNVVFTEEDKKLYDVFIYMNTPAERIVQNAKSREIGRADTFYEVEQVDDWKNFELSALHKGTSNN
jgi:adenylate kinase